MDAEVIDPKVESTLNSMNSESYQMSCTELLCTSIEDAQNKKKTLASTMQSVWKLMQQVECEEKAAEKAKADFFLKMDELNQELLLAEETKKKLLRKVHGEKEDLAIKMECLYKRVGHMLDVGDKSLDVLSEMHKSLKLRLASAISSKELAKMKKQENEAALAFKEMQIMKVVDEIDKLKEESFKNYKLQELLRDHDRATDVLNWEISDMYDNVMMLKHM